MKTITLKMGITFILAGYLSFGIASGQGTGVLFTCNDAYAYWNNVRFSPNNGFVNVSKPSGSSGIHLSLTNMTTMIDAFFSENYDVKIWKS